VSPGDGDAWLGGSARFVARGTLDREGLA
jgi:hypothetical protein